MTDAPALTRRSRVVLALAGGAVLAAGVAVYLDLRATANRLVDQTAALEAKIEGLEHTIDLFRYEQQADAGLGLPALVDRLRFWAPQLESATTPPSTWPAIKVQLRSVLSAFEELGPAIVPDLIAEFEQAESNDALRKWLLRAILEVDPERGRGMLERCLASLDLSVSPRIRMFAADRLLERDPASAGRLLRRILRTETHRGLDIERLDPALRERYPNAAQNVQPYRSWFFFIQKYLASGDPELEPTLLMLIGRRNEHSFLTLQECVKALGKIGSRAAVDPIKDLYERPPRGYTPMFRTHCLDSLGQILGAEACDYFKQLLRDPDHKMIRRKLTELIKTYCSA